MSLFNLLTTQTVKNPSKIAIVLDEKEYSYNQLLKLVQETILIFKKKGVKKNDIILILENNTLFHVLSLFAISYLNITAVPLGTGYSIKQVKKFIKITNANCILGSFNYCKIFNKVKQIKIFIKTDKIRLITSNSKIITLNKKNIKKNDLKKNYIISMTSGSTSKPKPLAYSQKTKIIRYKLFKKLYKIDKSDTIIITCPVTTSLGMRMLFLPLLTGSKCIIMRKFTSHLYFDYVQRHKVTFSALVPSQIDELVKESKKFKNFFLKKGLVSASSKLFENTKKKIINKKINLFEMYGAAEVGTITNINLNKMKANSKSVGKIYDKRISIKILSETNKYLPKNNVGEIICKTPGQFEGYLDLEDLTKNAFFKGHFKTGDIGYLDEKNNLFYLGRKKNIIKRSGINIYPEDIEGILLKNSKIKEVAVIPYTKNSSTKITLFVKKDKFLNYELVRNICLKKLSTFQLPNEIRLISKFPKTSSLKIDKQKIKKNFLKN